MIARFVIRPANNEKTVGDILIGALSKFQSALKPDTVYEIEEILGQLIIKEVGQSIVPMNKKDKTEGKIHDYNTSWNSRIDHVMEIYGNKLLISNDEYESLKNEVC